MWIVIGVGIPVLIIATAIAVWPLMSRSVRFHRWEHARMEGRERQLRPGRVQASFPLCAAQFETSSAGALIAERNRHLLRNHAQSGPEATPAARSTRSA